MDIINERLFAIQAKHSKHFKDGNIVNHITLVRKEQGQGIFHLYHQVDTALPKDVYDEIVNTFLLEYPK